MIFPGNINALATHFVLGVVYDSGVRLPLQMVDAWVSVVTARRLLWNQESFQVFFCILSSGARCYAARE